MHIAPDPPAFELGPPRTPAEILRLEDAPASHLQELRSWASDREFAEDLNRLAQILVELQTQLDTPGDRRREGAGTGRLFHYEHAGIVVGHLEVLPVEARYRHGMLGRPAGTRWPVLVRFSNGVGWPRRNSSVLARPADVRGMSILRFEYDPSRPLDEQTIRSHAILGTNGPVPFGNLEKFIEFARVNQNRGFLNWRLLWFDLFQLPEVSILANTLPPVDTLTRETFHHGHAYALNARRGVKLNWSVPESHRYKRGTVGTVLTSLRPHNFLEARLYEDLAGAPVEWVLNGQFEQLEYDEGSLPREGELARARRVTPLEDVLVRWTEENAPSVPLLGLVLYPQARPPELIELGDRLAFNPGRVLDGHYPLGLTGWGRVVLYDVMARWRGAIPLFSAEEQKAYRRILAIHEEIRRAAGADGPCVTKVGN